MFPFKYKYTPPFGVCQILSFVSQFAILYLKGVWISTTPNLDNTSLVSPNVIKIASLHPSHQPNLNPKRLVFVSQSNGKYSIFLPPVLLCLEINILKPLHPTQLVGRVNTGVIPLVLFPKSELTISIHPLCYQTK
jgi:hypothetical protein